MVSTIAQPFSDHFATSFGRNSVMHTITPMDTTNSRPFRDRSSTISRPPTVVLRQHCTSCDHFAAIRRPFCDHSATTSQPVLVARWLQSEGGIHLIPPSINSAPGCPAASPHHGHLRSTALPRPPSQVPLLHDRSGRALHRCHAESTSGNVNVAHALRAPLRDASSMYRAAAVVARWRSLWQQIVIKRCSNQVATALHWTPVSVRYHHLDSPAAARSNTNGTPLYNSVTHPAPLRCTRVSLCSFQLNNEMRFRPGEKLTLVQVFCVAEPLVQARVVHPIPLEGTGLR